MPESAILRTLINHCVPLGSESSDALFFGGGGCTIVIVAKLAIAGGVADAADHDLCPSRSSWTINSQQFDHRRGEKNLTECLHPLSGLILRLQTAAPKRLELIELFELDFKLERTATVSALVARANGL